MGETSILGELSLKLNIKDYHSSPEGNFMCQVSSLASIESTAPLLNAPTDIAG